MALIIMCCHDTDENGRSAFTMQTISSIFKTVDVSLDRKHRLIIVDNNSCEKTKNHLSKIRGMFVKTIDLPENMGTARGVNKALSLRRPGEYCIKVDNDVVIHQTGWPDQMEDVMRRMPQIGILGLKRVDLQESPTNQNPDYRSRFIEVPHEPGQRWRVVEECKQVMGTCTMLSPQLLDKVGFYYQMGGLYGFDDSLMCVRSNVAGFMNCFLHGIDIDHIDPGGGSLHRMETKVFRRNACKVCTRGSGL